MVTGLGHNFGENSMSHSKSLILLFLLMAFGIGMLGYVIPEIHIWEATHNYPFGKLCDVFNNC